MSLRVFFCHTGLLTSWHVAEECTFIGPLKVTLHNTLASTKRGYKPFLWTCCTIRHYCNLAVSHRRTVWFLGGDFSHGYAREKQQNHRGTWCDERGRESENTEAFSSIWNHEWKLNRRHLPHMSWHRANSQRSVFWRFLPYFKPLQCLNRDSWVKPLLSTTKGTKSNGRTGMCICSWLYFHHCSTFTSFLW